MVTCSGRTTPSSRTPILSRSSWIKLLAYFSHNNRISVSSQPDSLFTVKSGPAARGPIQTVAFLQRDSTWESWPGLGKVSTQNRVLPYSFAPSCNIVDKFNRGIFLYLHTIAFLECCLACQSRRPNFIIMGCLQSSMCPTNATLKWNTKAPIFAVSHHSVPQKIKVPNFRRLKIWQVQLQCLCAS